MQYDRIHNCLDCNYTGALVHIGGDSQCPRCASRAVWPISGWTKAACQALVFHDPDRGEKPRQSGCCELIPTFFGGCLGHR